MEKWALKCPVMGMIKQLGSTYSGTSGRVRSLARAGSAGNTQTMPYFSAIG
jgi:hypothetical protein